MNWHCRLFAVAMILLGCGSAGAVEGLTVLEHGLPAVLEAGSVVAVPVEVVNDGPLAWSSEAGFAFSYHWLDAAGETLIRDGRRTPLPDSVPPGSRVDLVATIEVPRGPGDYLLQWDVVQEGVQWLSSTDATPSEPIQVLVTVGYAFTVVESSSLRVMTAGSESVVELVLQNVGSRPWAADSTFAAAYHWLSENDGSVRQEGQGVVWEGRRTGFPMVVASGETVVIEMVIEAPEQPGLWHLQWDLVEEGVCWFSERMPEAPISVGVVVVPNLFHYPEVWAFAVLLAAAAAVAAGSRGGPPGWIAFLAVTDLIWCVGGIVFKQAVVLSEAGLHPSLSGWMLMAGTAAGAGLLVLGVGERWRPWVCWIVAAAVTALLWGDALYLRFFNDLPGAGQIAAVSQIGNVEASVVSLMRTADIWFWLDLLPGMVLVVSLGRIRRREGPGSRRVTALVLAVVMVAGCLVGASLMMKNPGILNQVFRRVLVAREVGIINQQAMDTGQTVIRRFTDRALDPQQYDQVVDWFSQRSSTRSGAGPQFGAAADFNLVMIQVESLQGFVIGLEIDGREVTPFLNRWTEEALWFSNFTDQTRHGRSSDAELATQASLLPMTGGATAFRYGENDFIGLAEVLSEAGYHTMSAVPFDGSFWNRRVTHEAFGFAKSFFVEDFGAGESVGWGLSDREFLAQAADRVETVERPFAAYLLTLSLHHPFDGFPPHLETLDIGEWDGTPFGNFLHTMHFFDASLAAFVADLERRGLAESTVIAIWGDHDAGFDWRPKIAAQMGVDHNSIGWYLSQEVPLFIRVPGAGFDLRGERTRAGGHVDVTPTLLALLGVDPALYAFVGRNLLGEPGDVPVIGEYGCWRTSDLLFLAAEDHVGGGRCLDIDSLKEVEISLCDEGRFAARRKEAVSRLVLEHDLQRRIHIDLSGGGSGLK